MILTVRPGSDVEKRKAIVETWYRSQIRDALAPLLATWEPVIGVTVDRFFVPSDEDEVGKLQP